MVTWIVAGLVASLALLALELALRDRRHRPSVDDEPLAWVQARRSVTGDPRAVAFVGASRMALGVSLTTFATLAPDRRAAQLALNGIPSLGVLEDLAGDPSFRGLVIFDAVSWELSDPLAFDHARPWTSRDRPLWRMPGAVANRALAIPFRERLATLGVGGRHFLESGLENRSLPAPRWTVTTRDRVTVGDYSLAHPGSLLKQQHRVARKMRKGPLTSWRQHLARIDAAVRSLRARGGDVVFLHMPISGHVREQEDELYPRAEFWDRFAAATSAHTLHFADIPAMAALHCPDGMHLDGPSQAIFTAALVAELRARQLL